MDTTVIIGCLTASAEVDFIIQRKGSIVPIEVKSADNIKSKRLSIYISAYKPEYVIKLVAKNFGFEASKKVVPLYAALRSVCDIDFLKRLQKAVFFLFVRI